MAKIPLKIEVKIKNVDGFNQLFLETPNGIMQFSNSNGKFDCSCSFTDNGLVPYVWHGSYSGNYVNGSLIKKPPKPVDDPCVLTGSAHANSVHSNNGHYYCCTVIGVRSSTYPWLIAGWGSRAGVWSMALNTENWQSDWLKFGFSKWNIHAAGQFYNSKSSLYIKITRTDNNKVIVDYEDTIVNIINNGERGLIHESGTSDGVKADFVYTPTFIIIDETNKNTEFVRLVSDEIIDVSSVLNFKGNLKVNNPKKAGEIVSKEYLLKMKEQFLKDIKLYIPSLGFGKLN